tara:strand:- start:1036 stop:1281 length:246 start_codon:yes stop_codon:yes gene_type:complete
MRRLNAKKTYRTLFFVGALLIALFMGIFISDNLIIDPIINYLAAEEGARVFLSCILSWIGLSRLFNLFDKIFRSKKSINIK